MRSLHYIVLLASSLVFFPELRAQDSCMAEDATTNVVGRGMSSSGNPANPQHEGASANSGQPKVNGEPDWVRAWLRRVDAARASQPHFTAPIVTTHVILVQQYRYDMSWQQDPTGGITSN